VTVDATTGDRVPLELRLMDHQVLGPDDQMLGNVDDLELHEREGGLEVTGLLSGPAALAGRQGGRVGGWIGAIWRRLNEAEDPRTPVVPLEEVERVDSAVHLSAAASRTMEHHLGLERWLRRYVVSRIPGALGGEDDAPAGRRQAPVPVAGRQPGDGSHLLSDLLGAVVQDHQGHQLGTVVEVVAVRRGRTGSGLGPLTVQALVTSKRRLGQGLGYTMTPMGPWLLRVLMRAWHRDDRLLGVRDLTRIAWEDDPVRVLVRAGADVRHPHEVDW